MPEEKEAISEELTFVAVSLSQIKNMQGLLQEYKRVIKSAIERLTDGDIPAAAFMLGQVWTDMRDLSASLDCYVREGEVKAGGKREEDEEESDG